MSQRCHFIKRSARILVAMMEFDGQTISSNRWPSALHSGEVFWRHFPRSVLAHTGGWIRCPNTLSSTCHTSTLRICRSNLTRCNSRRPDRETPIVGTEEVGRKLRDPEIVDGLDLARVLHESHGEAFAFQRVQFVVDFEEASRDPTAAFGVERMLRRDLNLAVADHHAPERRNADEDFFDDFSRDWAIRTILMSAQNDVARLDVFDQLRSRQGPNRSSCGEARTMDLRRRRLRSRRRPRVAARRRARRRHDFSRRHGTRPCRRRSILDGRRVGGGLAIADVVADAVRGVGGAIDGHADLEGSFRDHLPTLRVGQAEVIAADDVLIGDARVERGEAGGVGGGSEEGLAQRAILIIDLGDDGLRRLADGVSEGERSEGSFGRRQVTIQERRKKKQGVCGWKLVARVADLFKTLRILGKQAIPCNHRRMVACGVESEGRRFCRADRKRKLAQGSDFRGFAARREPRPSYPVQPALFEHDSREIADGGGSPNFSSYMCKDR